jgi:HAE1 family hydrophobic/amphiphilic exporter-1
MMGLIALVGVYSGLQLPVSLFPNSQQPVVSVDGGYGPMTADEYRHMYGSSLEGLLRKIQTKSVRVEEVDATYGQSGASISVRFRWGDDPDDALREVETVLAQMRASIGNPRDYYLSTWINQENSGFLALSFYSKERSTTEIFKIIDPVISPRIKQVSDAQNPNIWNPQAQEVRVELKPDVMAALQVTTRMVENAVRQGFETRQGGSFVTSGKSVGIMMPRHVQSAEDLGSIALTTPARRIVPLRDIATITLGPSQNASNIYKTSGASSVVLFASPKPGGNVKAMAEDIKRIVDDATRGLPKDIGYRLLVDPSDFIRSSIRNVFHEVILGSCLAVLVLFVFIGSPKNVATAAIEIPISLVLAFILMRITGMNINLISLGGLALSAGMNVDASVVVMENIFRHLENVSGKVSAEEKLRIVTRAVSEVKGPVIASTITSLVVFLPLGFTSNLSYAILGDLAKSVVFSHAFSAIVALILVPTVRLHIMSRESEISHPVSPIEPRLKWLESKYSDMLSKFMSHAGMKRAAMIVLPVILVSLIFLVLPRLPKEVVGTPDTDWIFMSVRTEGHTKTRQMEMILDQVERDLMDRIGARVDYTFYQIWNPDGGALMVRLKDKSAMAKTVKEIEDHFRNTATLKFWAGPFNPSELPLPDPPHLLIGITGGTAANRVEASSEIADILESKQVFPRIRTIPDAAKSSVVTITPNADQWKLARASGFAVEFDDIMDQFKTVTSGRVLGDFPFGSETYNVALAVGGVPPQSVDEVGSFSVAVGSKIVPLRALADVKQVPKPPVVRRINDREVNYISGRLPELSKSEAATRRDEARKLVSAWEADYKRRNEGKSDLPKVEFEDGEKEISEAIIQLSYAIGWSIVLIFITMVIQFGSLVEPLIVLAAVPLGIIGVLISLFVFGSSLSLNSALGVILLNGIAVANSIILVDFAKRLVDEGMSPEQAVATAARARLRPILITSLTTVLGMLPIACGFGEGGKVLQPLGIAVAGGLWMSMLLTLFVVPALHAAYLLTQNKATGGQRAV